MHYYGFKSFASKTTFPWPGSLKFSNSWLATPEHASNKLHHETKYSKTKKKKKNVKQDHLNKLFLRFTV